jgi:hypothetical protein
MRGRAICPINKLQFRDVRLTASICIYVIKWFPYKPRQSLSVPGAWGYQTSRQSAHESGNFDSLIPQAIFLLLISFRVWVHLRAILRPGGICQRNIFIKTSGIEPATFLLLAHWRHRVPPPPCDQIAEYWDLLLQDARPGSDFWEEGLAISVLLSADPHSLAGELRLSLMRGSTLLFPLWSDPTQRECLTSLVVSAR